MGLISKIEDKLSSSSHKKEEQRHATLDDQHVGTTQSHTGTGSHLQHPVGSNTTHEGSGITGGTALGGLSGQDTNYTGTTTQGHHLPGTATSHGQRGNDIDVGSRDHNVPRKPFDPYSAKGQQTAANAADARGSYEDPSGISRSRDGGITNAGVNDKDFVTGPHSSLQNPSAIPTAGGEKVGGGATGPYDSTHGSTHGHHGTHGVVRASDPTRRDDTHHSGGHTGIGSHLPGSNTTHHHGSGIQTGTHDRHPGHTTDQHVSFGNRPVADTPLAQDSGFTQRHTGPTTTHHDAGHHTGSHTAEALTGGAIGDAGANQAFQRGGQHGQQYDQGYQQAQQHHQGGQLPGHTISSEIGGSDLGGGNIPQQQQSGFTGAGAGAGAGTGVGTAQGSSLPTEKKLGGAYEAGYRDAVQHLQAEGRN